MTHRKLKWALRLGAALILAACNALKLAPPPYYAESAALERQSRLQHGPAEVQFTTRDGADAIKEKLLDAFMAESLSVSATQERMIEAKLAPTTALAGIRYAVVARAIILPLSDSTRVLLYGEQSASNEDGKRVDSKAYGKAGATWLSLLKIASRLQPDSTRRVVVVP